MRNVVKHIAVALSFFALVGITAAAGDEKKDEKKSAPGWYDSFTIKGDFRLRYDSVDEEGKDVRNRERIRARLGIDAQVVQDVKIGLEIATGDGDPVSTNQTLSDAASKKQFLLSLAYFDWNPSALKGLHFVGGKIRNPFINVGDGELIWDSDLTPEGCALTFVSSGDTAFFINAADFWVQERSAESETYMFGGQAGLKFKMNDAFQLTAGGGIFAYTDLQGYPTLYTTAKGFGNTLDEEGFYYNDYTIAEAFFDCGGKIGPVPWTLFTDYVVNTAADTEDDMGYLAGFGIGKCKDPYSIEFKYNYRHLEKDAVVGAFTFSDFVGGGTDGEGHMMSLGFQAAKNIKTAVNYQLATKGIDADTDYSRLQFDFNFKF